MLKKIYHTIINLIKWLITVIIKFITDLFTIKNPKKEIIIKQEIINNNIDNSKINITDNNTSLPDDNNIKTEESSVDHKGKSLPVKLIKRKDNIINKETYIIYTKDTIDTLIDYIIEKNFKIKVKDLTKETKEVLKERKEKLIPKVLNKLEDKKITTLEQLETKVEKIVLEEFKEKPLILQPEEDKNEKLKNIYYIVKPLNKEINIDKETTQTIDNKPIKEDIKEEKIEEEIKDINKHVIKEEPLEPSVELKNEVANIVIASALILADITKELLETNKLEKTDNIEDKINKLENKKEKLEQELNIKLDDKKIDELKEEKESPKEDLEEEKIKQEEKEKQKQKEKEEEKKKEEEKQKQYELEKLRNEIEYYENKKLLKYDKETLEIIGASKIEVAKEDLEDKNYEYLEYQLNEMLYSMELFSIEYEGKMSDEQIEKLKRKQDNIEQIKKELEQQKEKDTEKEEKAYDEKIKDEEKIGLKKEISKVRDNYQEDLHSELISNIDELNRIESTKANLIERNLLKRAVRRTLVAATIPSILSLPFIRNKHFFALSGALLVNSNLRFIDGILRRQTAALEEPDLTNIVQGQDALNAAINQQYENIDYLNHLETAMLAKHPEMLQDQSVLQELNSIRTKLNKDYNKLNKRQETLTSILRRQRKNQKKLIWQRKKDNKQNNME